MIEARVFHNKKAEATSKDSPSYLDNRIGFWATISAVHSNTNRVDIVSDTGLNYYGLPVLSREWVCQDDNKEFVSGSRNLPPINSRVLVFMPTHTIAGAIVIGSGFAAGEKSSHVVYAKNDNEIDKKNNSSEKISVSGWDEQENYKNGNKSWKFGENIEFQVNPADDGDSIKKGITIKAFENEIKITPDGIELTDKNGSIIKAISDGLEITDKNNRKIVTNNNGIELYYSKNDTSKNYIKLGSTISMKGNAGTLEIS